MTNGSLMRSVVFFSGWIAATAAWAQSINVTTHHYDNLRTGWNAAETVLTPTSVGGGTFQLQHSVTLDEQVDAQPLLVTNQTIAGAKHDVVYVATENDSVYALDAATGAILVHVSLGTPVPQSKLPGNCGNNSSVVGINSTPVIDAAGGTLYVVAYTYESGAPVYRLHALDIDTLTDKVPAVVVSASAKLTNGTTYAFTPGSTRQRAALLLANGNVYAAFASFCDVNANTSRGWVLGWQAGSLTPLAANNLTNKLAKTPDNFYLTSIWMSGSGPAASAAGNIYFITGNTDYDGTQYNRTNNLAESTVEISADLSTARSFFTPGGGPDGHAALDQSDEDFGSGGILLLPPQAGQSTNLAVAAGKVGLLYVLNADTLGNNGPLATGNALSHVSIGGCWCMPSYFTGDDGHGRIVSSGGNNIAIWKVNIGATVTLSKTATGGAVTSGQDPGFFTSVSSNGTATPIIWAVSRPASNKAPGVSLYAFDTAGNQLFVGAAGTWPKTRGNANLVPVEANGRVYVASYKSLSIFGLGGGAAAVSLTRPIPDDLSPGVLPNGQHAVYGTVQAIDGTTITVVKRSDAVLQVDAADAYADFKVAPPSVGHGIMVTGPIDEDGVMHAVTVLHAKDSPGMWPPDR